MDDGRRPLPSFLGGNVKRDVGTKSTDSKKPLIGVTVSLSGFKNPLRSTLRSQAISLGATYVPNLDDKCTHLICAFKDTPKYFDAKSSGVHIVTKEWIDECIQKKSRVREEKYSFKDDVDIEEEDDDEEEELGSSDLEESEEEESDELDLGDEDEWIPKKKRKIMQDSIPKQKSVRKTFKDVVRPVSMEELHKQELDLIRKRGLDPNKVITTALEMAQESFQADGSLRLVYENWTFDCIVPRGIRFCDKLEDLDSVRKVYEGIFRNDSVKNDEDVNERDLVIKCGGKVAISVDSKDITHFVCNSKEECEIESSKLLNAVCIEPLWITQCVKKSRVVLTEPFQW